ncbi:hypothetical protein GGR25_003532 [Kaistia hirudinis]|uniref:HTH rpiR-type domain-containing protein n=1 Tax=Kaistia hirudinis TaxID=1293440 RepID=A0A840ASH5_9HYPH|nr:MurR/RpiR family transcriptional regulator [Kaistia hirudinis]MBB3932474.1 hypothetical protein [Kaistia hirudinis]
MSPNRLGDPLATERQVDGSILNRLQDEIERLPSALARIAKYIVENPEKALRQSISQLGEYSDSEEASILRLCRQIGCRSSASRPGDIAVRTMASGFVQQGLPFWHARPRNYRPFSLREAAGGFSSHGCDLREPMPSYPAVRRANILQYKSNNPR